MTGKYTFVAGGKMPSGGNRRKGAIIVLAAALMVFILACLAFTVDVGFMCMARTQAQSCADAAALAAALEMVNNSNLSMSLGDRIAAATQKAEDCAALQDINSSLRDAPSDQPPNLLEAVSFGRLENPNNLNEPISYSSPDNPNAVYVRVKCDPENGTDVPMFFARIFGLDAAPISASAVAVFSLDTTGGIEVDDDKPSTLMPFVIKEGAWDDLMANGGPDNWSYDPQTKTVSPGPDGIPEIKMFPDKDNGSQGNGKNKGSASGITPGNFGTVDIGNTGNGAPDLLRQIVEGPSEADLAYYGGELKLDSVTGTLELNGDCGMTASMKHALAQIIGQPKTIMLYNDVVGQGNNTWFTITRFVGVRVMDFDMTGPAADKYILVQPAMVQDSGAQPGDEGGSNFVGQPVHLVR